MSTIEKAAAEFISAAVEKGAEGGPRDDELYRKIQSSYRSLTSAGDAGLEAVRRLAAHKEPDVRLWASVALLARGESEYLSVVELIEREGGIRGLVAEMVLDEYRSGQLREP